MGDGRVANSALGEAADQLSDALLRVEDVIRGLKFGVRSRVQIDKNLFFGFGKEEGDWGFFLEEVGAKAAIRQLFGSSIETRIKAAKKVPNLLKALLEERDAVALGVAETVVWLNAFLDTMNAASQEGEFDKFIDEIPTKWAHAPAKDGEAMVGNLGTCLNCSANPAVSKVDTVPLCRECLDASKPNARGVRMKGKTSSSSPRPS